ncbi:hypothetical protein Tco_0312138 [Tanacetum coccineum]
MRFVDGWDVVINRFCEKLSSWKANTLSIDGRLTLVKAILGSLPIYYLSLFKAPSLVIDALETIRRRFFCGFKDSHRGFSTPMNLLRVGGLWYDILKAKKNIEMTIPSYKASFVIKIGFGMNTLFWKDPWCGSGQRLMEIFPRLFALDSDKDCKLRPTDIDKWTWSGDVSGVFRVRSLSKNIDNIILSNSRVGEHHIWNSWIPLDKNGRPRIKGKSLSSVSQFDGQPSPKFYSHLGKGIVSENKFWCCVPDTAYGSCPIWRISEKSALAVGIYLTWSRGFIFFLIAALVEARISLIMFEFSSCLLADSAMNLVSDSSRLGLRSGYKEFPLFRW